MAYGKIKVDTVIYDNAGSDVEVAVSGIPSAADINAKAPLASPALTGTPTAPTAASGTNTTQIATTAFVTAASSGGVSLDTANTWTKGQRGEVRNSIGSTFSVDMNDANNFHFETNANFTVAATDITKGQCGSIFIEYGGNHTGTFPTTFKFVGGSAGINLTSTANAIDRLDYIVLDDTSGSEVITCNFTANYVA